MSITNQLPPSKRLSVPYRSQLDNILNPQSACNVTSVAMILEYWRMQRQENYEHYEQFEDEIYQYATDSSISRHSPIGLQQIIQHYGLIDDFTMHATVQRCKHAISRGQPLITHGYFTSFGHIICLVGYDESGFIVHDPYGEWFEDGYARNDNTNPERGKYQHYSYDLIKRKCAHDGNFWVHFIREKDP